MSAADTVTAPIPTDQTADDIHGDDAPIGDDCPWDDSIGLQGWLRCSGQAWAGLRKEVWSVVGEGPGPMRHNFQVAVYTNDRRPFLLTSLGAGLLLLLLSLVLLRLANRPATSEHAQVEPGGNG